MRMLSMLVIATCCVSGATASATPLQDCMQSSVLSVCLDAKLKAANKQLNATLKAAQERIEPRSSAALGYEVVSTIEQVDLSLADGGGRVVAGTGPGVHKTS